MARATERTWLSLDRWAQIMGVHPMNFNQLFHDTLNPQSRDCADVWYQQDWQSANQISRETLALAIRDAELTIAEYVGYNLLPDWVADERQRTARPSRPELYPRNVSNVRGQAKSIEVDRKHIISGGIRGTTEIATGISVVRSDDDGDGFDELCTVTFATTVTEACEIRLFYPGESGAPAWEIRPINVSLSGGTATVTFSVWQIVAKNNMVEINPDPIDAATAGSFETTVDAFRVYNDPSQMATLLWERDPELCSSCSGTGCPRCTHASQTACLLARNRRLGFFAYESASWDADDEEWDAKALAVERDPDQLRLWYYSGYESTDPRVDCPRVELDPYWEKPVAYFAAGLLDRPICACNNAQEYVEHWREDLARIGTDRSFQVSPADLDNPFGTTRGAIAAWKAVQREGRKVHA